MKTDKKIYFVLLIFTFLSILSSRSFSENFEKYKGVNLYLNAHDIDTSLGLDTDLERLKNSFKENKINSIALVWPIFTDNITSNEVYRGWNTPNDYYLQKIINYFTQNNFKVFLRPIIDEAVLTQNNKDDWRGTLRPKSVKSWFQSYSNLILEYAELAEKSGAESFSIGTELTSMEKYSNNWSKLSFDVRKLFKGKITYSSNWVISNEIPWKDLDFISVDAFFGLDINPNANVDEIVNSQISKSKKLINEAKIIGKPLIFSELGVTSQYGSFRKPWKWDHETGVDQDSQRKFYKAGCIVWFDKLDGLYWWFTNIWVLPDVLNDKGFNPFGKTAESEISICFK